MLNKTQTTYIATRVLDTPFWAIYNMLPVIIYKDLHATPLQLALTIALKPLVSLLSMYWSARVNARPDRLKSNIIYGRLLGYLPFFFFPFIDSAWFFIASFALYMMLAVGIVPAWMEVLKLTIPKETREKVFSYTQAFGYIGGGLLPFALGFLLDEYFQSWRWLFPLAASLALLSFFFQRSLVIPVTTASQPPAEGALLKPWKTAWNLLKERPDFRKFQIGSMIIGCGLMIIQPALPIYFVDYLALTYTEIAFAIALCKGISFALASPFWSKWIHKVNIYTLLSWIAAFGFLFPTCLYLSQVDLAFLWFGYFCYGIMQSGNELLWNMSGPFFSGDKDSSKFTSVNLLAVGMRGCIIPFLGSLLCTHFGASLVISLSALLPLLAIFPLYTYQKTAKLSES